MQGRENVHLMHERLPQPVYKELSRLEHFDWTVLFRIFVLLEVPLATVISECKIYYKVH